MSKYKVEEVTRIEEGSSLEDVLDGNAYETAYIVYNEEGEIIHDTTDKDIAYSYLRETNEVARGELANGTKYIITKTNDYYAIWFGDDYDEAEYTGYSVSGTWEQIMEELKEVM